MENLALKNDDIYEILDGKIVYMSPRPAVNHNIVAGNIFLIFGSFLKGKSCTAFSDGVDVHLTENDTVIPDVMIVCNRDIIKKNGIYGTPDLVVEVLSPSTAKNDKGYKKDLYQKCGVKEYWIVEAELQSIEVYLLKDGQFILDNVYSVFPNYMLEKMTDDEKNKIETEFKTYLFSDLIISLNEIFENIL